MGLSFSDFRPDKVVDKVQRFTEDLTGETAARQAREAARAQERFQRNQRKQRRKLVGQVRESYGMGDSALAIGNRNKINSDLEQMFRQQAGQGIRMADDDYSATATANRQNAARAGLTGSSQDSASRGFNLANYLRNRRSAIANASGMRANAQNQLTNQRLGLEQAIQGGTMAAPDFQNIAMQQQQALGAQQANIMPAALGNMLTMGGNIYRESNYQQGRGNRGFSLSGGSIT